MLLLTILNLLILCEFKGEIFLSKEKRQLQNAEKLYQVGKQQNAIKEPKIKILSLNDSEHDFATIQYDDIHQDVYFLTFDTKNLTKTSSNFYVSRDLGITMTRTPVLYNKKAAIVDQIYFRNNLLVLNDRKIQVLFVSKDRATTFNYYRFDHPIININVHPTVESLVAVIDEVSNLYISTDAGINWSSITNEVTDFHWSTQKKYFYILKKSIINNSTSSLVKGEAGVPSLLNELDVGCTHLGVRKDIIYAIKKTDTEKVKLIISHNDGPFKEAIFPKYLNPIFYEVHETTINEVFVLVVNNTKDTILYSGLLFDLKFVKLLDKIGIYSEDNKNLCADVQFFDNLPGVVISYLTVKPSKFYEKRTAISYNHGVKFGHVKAPHLYNNKTCEWPQCFLRLDLECASLTDTPIISVEKAPNILIAKGSIWQENTSTEKSMFISIDAGLNWVKGLSYLHEYTILDHGGVIVALQTSYNVIYYSYDIGLRWKYKKLSEDKFIGLYIHHDNKGTPTSAVVIGYDYDTNDWQTINIDFSDVLDTKCEKDNYDLFTPGFGDKSECFQGKRNVFYRRRHYVQCMSIISELDKVEPTICPCTADDFGCTYGYYLKDNNCVLDPDAGILDKNYTCNQGDFYFEPNSKSILHGDVCYNSNDHDDQKASICNFTDNHDSIMLFSSYNMFFINLNSMKNVSRVPINNFNDLNAISLDFSLALNCLYFLKVQGVYELCLNTKEKAFQQKVKTLNRDIRGQKILFEPFGFNLYIQTEDSIIVKNVHTKVEKTLVNNSMKLYSLFSKDGYFAYLSTSYIGDEVALFLNFCTLDGIVKNSFRLSNAPNIVTYVSHNNTLIGYTGLVMIIFDLSKNTTKEFTYKIGQKLLVYVDEGNRYDVTNIYFAFNEKVMTYFESATDAKINFAKFSLQNGCQYAHCSQFCFPLPNKKYACACSDGMELSADNRCKCDASHPNCTNCKADEFKCGSQECIDILDKCDGVEQCADGSDEQNCSIKCGADEFICPDLKTCVDITKRCDKFNDCPDGYDEKGCHYHTCKVDEFECDNENCISKSKYCDGVDDCGDYSDEQLCLNLKCLAHQWKCDNGQCISPNQVCDGVFDCEDWSDETHCRQNVDIDDVQCAIHCDNKCIPLAKVCNHITDCSDGSDEIGCDHKILCPNDEDLKCTSDFLCYSKDRKCDNFKDCSDGSDELNCPKYDFCSNEIAFRCLNGFQCVSINEYCDGISQCQDSSDEPSTCETEPNIRNLDIIRMNDSIKVVWAGNKLSADTVYSFTLIPRQSYKDMQNITIKGNRFHILKNLIPCDQYVIIVMIKDTPIGQSIDLIPHNSVMNSPTNLNFTNKNFLSWKYTDLRCLPRQFYITCNSKDSDVIYKNFSSNHNITFYKNYTNCSVSTCVTNVFNLSCSQFVSTRQIPYQSKSSQALPIVISILVMVLLIICVTVLYRKGYLTKFWIMLKARLFKHSLTPFNYEEYNFNAEKEGLLTIRE